jgi:hypothetical protein
MQIHARILHIGAGCGKLENKIRLLASNLTYWKETLSSNVAISLLIHFSKTFLSQSSLTLELSIK